MSVKEQAKEPLAGGHLNNVNKVFGYLVDSGWKISRAGSYKHRKAGILQPDDRGRYAIEAVDRYATHNLRRRDGSAADGEDKQSVAKRDAEIRKLIAHAKILENKAKSAAREWIPRKRYEKELASRAAVFKSDLNSWCQSEASGICHMVDGNEDMIPDLIQYLINSLETILDRYAQ